MNRENAAAVAAFDGNSQKHACYADDLFIAKPHLELIKNLSIALPRRKVTASEVCETRALAELLQSHSVLFKYSAHNFSSKFEKKNIKSTL